MMTILRKTLLTLVLLTLVSPLSSPVTAAEVSKPASDAALAEVLDNWATALGGREQLAAVQTIHTHYRLKAYGMEGTIDEWLHADSWHRFDLDLAGIFTISQVRGPGGAWQRDQNAKVSDLAGHNLESAITDAYLNTWSPLLTRRMPGTVSLLEPDPETGAFRIDIKPVDGEATIVFLDASSYLPQQRQTQAARGEMSIVTYSDWQMFEGILLPAQVHQSSGPAENDMHLELLEAYFNTTPPANAFERPVDQADDVKFAGGNEANDIPLFLDGVHIFLKVQINDSRPLDFVLDTGAAATVIDRALAEELNFELTGQIMAGGSGEGTAEVSFLQDATFAVPGVEVQDQTVAAVDLRGILEARFGRAIDGILGYDFISRFIMTIDYQEQKLHLRHSMGWQYTGDGKIIPINIIDNQPHCEVTLQARGREPLVCDLMIDTGAGAALHLARPFTTTNDLLATVDKQVPFTGGYGIGGESTSILGRLDELRIGELTFDSPLVDFSRDTRGGGADAILAGLLGGRILEQFTVIFAYENEQMILEPNSRYGQSTEFDGTGIVFGTGGRGDWHHFTILRVTEGGSAAEADILPGDVITAVNGKPASDLRKWEIVEMFKHLGDEVVLDLDRDGDHLQVRIRTRRII